MRKSFTYLALLITLLSLSIISCANKNELKRNGQVDIKNTELRNDDSVKANYIPTEGYVPDAETAVKIAEAIWLPIYGEKINSEKPFIAKLYNGVWTVKGTLPKEHLGGVAEIDISKKDCKVLRVIHGK